MGREVLGQHSIGLVFVLRQHITEFLGPFFSSRSSWVYDFFYIIIIIIIILIEKRGVQWWLWGNWHGLNLHALEGRVQRATGRTHVQKPQQDPNRREACARGGWEGDVRLGV
jgi:hypothetical protein